MLTLPLADVRNRLSALIDDVARTHETVTVTRNGVPAAVLLSADDYESIMETLALINDPADMARLIEAEQSIAAGDGTTRDEMAAILAARFGKSAA